MTESTSLTVKDLIHAIWRRRWLMIVPFLILAPLSALVAKLAPKVYVAHTLMLLQEGSNDGFLSKSQTTDIRIQDRIGGLRALLKSNSILETSVRQIYGEEATRDPAKLAYLVKDTDDALSLDLVGTDFLEFRLKGSKPNALGKTLEVILLNFLETLMGVPSNSGAVQLLMARRETELKTADATLAHLKTAYEAQLLVRDKKLLDMQQVRTQLDAKQALLNQAVLARNSARGATQDPSEKQGSLDTLIRQAAADVKKLVVSGSSSTDQHDDADAHARLVKSLQEFDSKVSGLESEVASLKQQLAQGEAVVAETDNLERQVKFADADDAAMREHFDSFTKRYSGILSTRSHSILAAPELMKLVDPPVDPTIPEQSSLRYLIGGLIASLLLGLSLSVLAELTDPVLRRPVDFAALTGVPVIARLPRPDMVSS